VKQLDQQWKWLKNENDIKLRLNMEVKRLRVQNESTHPQVILSATGNETYSRSYDIAVICTGFGIERMHHLIDFQSYWRDDALHQEILDNPIPRRFFISGCGDGGIVDMLRLCISNFDHRTINEKFVSFASLNPRDLSERLLQIEEDAYCLLHKGQKDLSLFLYEKYSDVIPSSTLIEIIESISSKIRKDTKVILNSTNDLPLSLNTSLLNRFVTFILLKCSAFEYWPGTLDLDCLSLKNDGNGYILRAPELSKTDEEHFHHVIVRHGPKRMYPIAEPSQIACEKKVSGSKGESEIFAGSPTWKIKKAAPRVLWKSNSNSPFKTRNTSSWDYLKSMKYEVDFWNADEGYDVDVANTESPGMLSKLRGKLKEIASPHQLKSLVIFRAKMEISGKLLHDEVKNIHLLFSTGLESDERQVAHSFSQKEVIYRELLGSSFQYPLLFDLADWPNDPEDIVLWTQLVRENARNLNVTKEIPREILGNMLAHPMMKKFNKDEYQLREVLTAVWTQERRMYGKLLRDVLGEDDHEHLSKAPLFFKINDSQKSDENASFAEFESINEPKSSPLLRLLLRIKDGKTSAENRKITVEFWGWQSVFRPFPFYCDSPHENIQVKLTPKSTNLRFALSPFLSGRSLKYEGQKLLLEVDKAKEMLKKDFLDSSLRERMREEKKKIDEVYKGMLEIHHDNSLTLTFRQAGVSYSPQPFYTPGLIWIDLLKSMRESGGSVGEGAVEVTKPPATVVRGTVSTKAVKHSSKVKKPM
jgi:hypothetical protein